VQLEKQKEIREGECTVVIRAGFRAHSAYLEVEACLPNIIHKFKGKIEKFLKLLSPKLPPTGPDISPLESERLE